MGVSPMVREFQRHAAIFRFDAKIDLAIGDTPTMRKRCYAGLQNSTPL
jgi:hypothetical protein